MAAIFEGHWEFWEMEFWALVGVYVTLGKICCMWVDLEMHACFVLFVVRHQFSVHSFWCWSAWSEMRQDSAGLCVSRVQLKGQNPRLKHSYTVQKKKMIKADSKHSKTQISQSLSVASVYTGRNCTFFELKKHCVFQTLLCLLWKRNPVVFVWYIFYLLS